MRRKADVRRVAERRYWREAEARVVVDAWRSSGETQSGFARRHCVGRGRLTRWVRRLRGEGSVRFHPVRLVESTVETGAPIELHLAGGRRVRVPRGFETEHLRRVLVVLEGFDVLTLPSSVRIYVAACCVACPVTGLVAG